MNRARGLLRHWVAGSFARLFAIWGFVVAQPLFHTLSENELYLIDRRVAFPELALFAMTLILVPPLLMVAVEVILRRLVSERARQAVHLGFVFVLAGVFGCYLLKLEGHGSAKILVAALLFAIVVTFIYARVRLVRVWLTVLAAAPLLFVALFLFDSPIRDLRTNEAPLAPTAESDVPIVVLVFDELPLTSLLADEDQIDAVRFPGFGRLARESTWYRNYTTAADHTTVALPAMLTGLKPDPDRLPVASDHPQNLFTLAAGSHELEVMETATDLCPENLCPERSGFLDRFRTLTSASTAIYGELVIPDRFLNRLPPRSLSWGEERTLNDFDREVEPSNEEVVSLAWDEEAQFAGFLEAIEDHANSPRERPPLVYEHAFIPHVPWRRLPSGHRYSTNLAEGPNIGPWGVDPRLIDVDFQRHLLQTQLSDRLVGQMISTLKRVGLWGRSLVVVVSDHGGSFNPDALRRVVEPANVGEMALVPLFVKRPGQRRGERVDARVSSVDLLPTIADAAGLSIPKGVDGRSALTNRPAGRGPLTVVNFVGETVTYSPAKLRRQVRAVLRRNRTIAGTRTRWPAPVPPALLGKRLDELVVRSERGVEFTLADPAALESVDLSSRFRPARITGAIVGEGRADVDRVLVAVNGVVRSIATVSPSDGAFDALVPAESFRDGRNTVEIAAIGRGDRLARIPPAS